MALAPAWGEELKRRPLPPLYRSGVIFKPEPRSNPCEEFADPYIVFKRKWGDCDDLVLWRLAELHAAGMEAFPQVMRALDGSGRYHIAVRHADGREEDPAKILYKGGPTF